MDIMDFIDLKKNSGEERRRAHDLFPALWISDLFMEISFVDFFWHPFSDPHRWPSIKKNAWTCPIRWSRQSRRSSAGHCSHRFFYQFADLGFGKVGTGITQKMASR